MHSTSIISICLYINGTKSRVQQISTPDSNARRTDFLSRLGDRSDRGFRGIFQCVTREVSQSYWPPPPVTGIYLHFYPEEYSGYILNLFSAVSFHILPNLLFTIQPIILRYITEGIKRIFNWKRSV
jgi:hypothetical protein